MPAWLGVVVFLGLFALVLIVVAVGVRIIEQEQKKKVSEILRAVGGSDTVLPSAQILDEGAQAESAVEHLPLYGKIKGYMDFAEIQGSPVLILVLMGILGAVGAFIGGRMDAPVMREGAMVGLGLLFGYLPYFFVKFKANQRMDAFEELFPEALDFLARSLRAGHAFSISLEMMSEEAPEPIGTEFRKIFHEHNLGAPIDVTLRNFANRVPLLDSKLFVSAVLLQRETGGNLAEVLTKLAYIIRERFRLKGQVKAASAHGRITAAILAVMPIITLILLNIIAPEYFKTMADDKHGQWIILGVVVLQVMGYFWMRRIINIKV